MIFEEAISNTSVERVNICGRRFYIVLEGKTVWMSTM